MMWTTIAWGLLPCFTLDGTYVEAYTHLKPLCGSNGEVAPLYSWFGTCLYGSITLQNFSCFMVEDIPILKEYLTRMLMNGLILLVNEAPLPFFMELVEHWWHFTCVLHRFDALFHRSTCLKLDLSKTSTIWGHPCLIWWDVSLGGLTRAIIRGLTWFKPYFEETPTFGGYIAHLFLLVDGTSHLGRRFHGFIP